MSRAALLLVAVTASAATGCVHGDPCLRLSDCATGYVCSMGTCVPVAPPSVSDSEALEETAPPMGDATGNEVGDAHEPGSYVSDASDSSDSPGESGEASADAD